MPMRKNSYLVSDRLDTRSNHYTHCEVVCDDGWYHRNTRLAAGAKRNWPTSEDEQYIRDLKTAIRQWRKMHSANDELLQFHLRYDSI